MDYPAARRALERRQESRIELGLDRVREHLEAVGRPQAGMAVIHVAGTNGKGSVCAILESVLRRAGWRTGLYISPHLFDVRERIRVGGRWIPEKDFARLMAATLRADKKRALTYFELLTSVAFQWFAENRIDVAVLETGLGGRLDATNIVETPLAAVITSISFDHMQFLGETLDKIAAEKAGIIKAGRPVFCGALPPQALGVVRETAARRDSPLTVCLRPWPSSVGGWERNTQRVGADRLHLLGAAQGGNVALARAVVDSLRGVFPVPARAWAAGLASVQWPGRFQVVTRGSRRVILDGAHNPEAMANLAKTWRLAPWSRRPSRWIVGVLRDKDAAGLLEPLAPFLKEVVTVRPPSPRAMEPAKLASIVRRAAPSARVTVETDCGTAVRSWLRSGPETAVVCGSFYLVGAAAEALG